MTDTKGRILVVSTGKELLDELTPSMSGRGLELICVPTLKYAAARLQQGDCSALIVDFAKVPASEREAFLLLHRQFPKVHAFALETSDSSSPNTLSPLRRLGWPLPMGFADQVRVTDRSVVILADQTLFMTGAVQTALQQAGVNPVTMESVSGLVDIIRQQIQERAAAAQPKKEKGGFWSKLTGDEKETAPEPGHFLGKAVVAQFPGTMAEAAALDAKVRAAIPIAVCYYLSGTDTGRYALQALKEEQPAFLPREMAGSVAGVLADMSDGVALRAKGKVKERIFLLDNFKPHLTTLGQALLNAGYEVTTSMDGEEALRLCSKGAFHLAAIGTSTIGAGLSGADLAQKLRERDPDLRIVFMVEAVGTKALEGFSQLVKLGIDDALLKPVEASRLIFSVERALERRFLLLENERLLKETKEQKDQLELINSFQKKFFATVAHDVKSPLTAILGYADFLTKKLKDQATELRYASNIHTSAKTLSVLISDLVDLAAIESGKLRVEIGKLNLLAVAQDVRARVEIQAQQRKIDFFMEVPPVVPPLDGDDARIGQVIQNLCTNAIQYTKEGGKVTIRVENQPDRVVVSVIDTGIGISKEDLPRVWERFFQTKEAQGMRKAGFGLGLKIAREIVQRHGGEMGIESELGAGSRFFFHIPVRK